MRIAIGGISNENTTFSPIFNRLEDFTIWADDALLTSGRYPFLEQFPKVEFIPTLFGRSLPGGPVESSAYQRMKDGILSRLQAAGPLDGVYLDLHGAMFVEGMNDAEADLAAAVRQIVGPDAIIAASMDLHGNVSQAYVDQIDIITCYRTAPHRDMEETRQRACELLVQAIENGVRPQIALTPIPVLLVGENTRTDVEPGARLWGSLPARDQAPGVLHTALFVGFAWVDEESAHAAAVVTGTDAQQMRRVADALGQDYFDARHEFNFGVESGSVDECIQIAMATPEQPVFLSDSGDNVTAGAVGDIPLFAERLLAHGATNALVVGLWDAEAVAACWAAGEGATVETTLGGKVDTLHGAPLSVNGRVQRLVNVIEGNRQAVLQVDGVTIVLTTLRQSFTALADFANVGVNPLDYKIVVVKLGYLFPELMPIAAKWLMTLSPGATDLDLAHLPYTRIKRPMFPADGEFEWSPAANHLAS